MVSEFTLGSQFLDISLYKGEVSSIGTFNEKDQTLVYKDATKKSDQKKESKQSNVGLYISLVMRNYGSS